MNYQMSVTAACINYVKIRRHGNPAMRQHICTRARKFALFLFVFFAYLQAECSAVLRAPRRTLSRGFHPINPPTPGYAPGVTKSWVRLYTRELMSKLKHRTAAAVCSPPVPVECAPRCSALPGSAPLASELRLVLGAPEKMLAVVAGESLAFVTSRAAGVTRLNWKGTVRGSSRLLATPRLASPRLAR